MRVNWSIIGRIAAAMALVYLALFVWPTPYREYNPPERFREWVMKVRVNRVTGAQQFLMFGKGWQTPVPPKDSTP